MLRTPCLRLGVEVVQRNGHVARYRVVDTAVVVLRRRGCEKIAQHQAACTLFVEETLVVHASVEARVGVLHRHLIAVGEARSSVWTA